MASALQVYPHFNPEDAAAVAAEFVSSLDNLPGEVTFLLQEIREKDERISQLLSRINQRHYGLTKSVKNLSTAQPPTGPAPFPLPIPTGTPLPTSHLSTKDAQNIAKIQTEWGKITQLQDDKVRLAERLERIVSRARERGRTEWRKVGGIDIEQLDEAMRPRAGELGGAGVLLPAQGLGGGGSGSSRGGRGRKSNVGSQSVSLASAISNSGLSLGSMPPPPAPSGRGGSRASSVAAGGGGSGRSGRGRSAAISDADAEAEAETEVEMTEVEEVEADDAIYCFCQQKSYGEMIGCDNDKCQYEWCVNINGPPPDTWYCPDCVQKLGFASSDGRQKDRKGRKK